MIEEKQRRINRMNKIYCGDCRFVMRHDILERGIKVDLIYLDPPFFTGKVQKGTWQPGAMEVSYEDSKRFWGTKTANGAPTWIKEVGSTRPAFAAYLEYMRKRLELCKRVLRNTGSIYLHCDYRASHYLKMVMDEVFGYKNFRNEIIWHKKGGIKAVSKFFPRKKDSLLFYVKSKKYTFNVQRGDPEANALYSRWIKYSSDGKTVLFKDFPKTDKVKFKDYTKRFVSRHKRDPEPDDIIYEFEGAIIDSVWSDIADIYRGQKERLGYPSQKPLSLLERIIETSSNEGDLVMDPFCGCGTAVAAAQMLNRQWIGIDIESDACTVMKKRFEDDFGIKTEIHLRNVDEVKKLKPNQFEAWVNEFYQAKKPMPDRGVDGITPEGWPIQTKTHKVKYNIVSQFLNDMRFHPDVPKPAKLGIIVSQTGFDESAMARAFQIKERDKINIKLVTPEDLLKEDT